MFFKRDNFQSENEKKCVDLEIFFNVLYFKKLILNSPYNYQKSPYCSGPTPRAHFPPERMSLSNLQSPIFIDQKTLQRRRRLWATGNSTQRYRALRLRRETLDLSILKRRVSPQAKCSENIWFLGQPLFDSGFSSYIYIYIHIFAQLHCI